MFKKKYHVITMDFLGSGSFFTPLIPMLEKKYHVITMGFLDSGSSDRIDV